MPHLIIRRLRRPARKLRWPATPSVLIAAALILLNSCFFLPREEEVLAPPLVEPPEISYQTHTVSVGTIEDSIRAFGAFTYAGQADLSFERRGGRLKTLHVRVGANVEKGRLIADLHTDNIEAEIAQAELSLRRAELAYQAAQDQYDTEYSLEFARADLRLAELHLEEAEEDLQREVALVEVTGGGAALSGLRRRVAEAEISVQKGVLTVRRLEEADTPLALELARIDVDAAELRLDQLDAELEATRLYAPISGKVTWLSRLAVEGEYLQAFQRIVRIADPTDLVFEYTGRDAGVFRVGMECIVALDDHEFPGTVILTEANVPFDQREEYEDTVQIIVPLLPREIGAGQMGVATLILARREDVLLLPRRAVQRYATRRYVNVLVNGVRVERDVEVGLETATQIEIIAGLAEGDEVVLR
ncbi:MAG: hypothetical protein KAU31_09850 [Spirochaetaceae bacterium]|nr:hypothetical protein [Spirochaetaceae bacterium]